MTAPAFIYTSEPWAALYGRPILRPRLPTTGALDTSSLSLNPPLTIPNVIFAAGVEMRRSVDRPHAESLYHVGGLKSVGTA
jgi:hypothetical protein